MATPTTNFNETSDHHDLSVVGHTTDSLPSGLPTDGWVLRKRKITPQTGDLGRVSGPVVSGRVGW